MSTVTKLRVIFGPKDSVRTFQKFPDLKKCSGVKKTEKSEANQSRKRVFKELDVTQPKKRLKLDYDVFTQCFKVLKLLMEHRLGLIFSEPVDPVKLKIPDYFSIISKPMDLGTIKSKLQKNAYSSVDEFAADVRLTFANAMRYNPPDNSVHLMAKILKKIFEDKWESLKKKKTSKLSGIDVTEGSKRHTLDVIEGSKRQPSKVTEGSKSQAFEEKGSKRQTFESQSSKRQTSEVTEGSKRQTSEVTEGSKRQTFEVTEGSKGETFEVSQGSKRQPSEVTPCSKTQTFDVTEVSKRQPSEVTPCSKRQKFEVGCSTPSTSESSNRSLIDKEVKTTSTAISALPNDKALRAATLKLQYADTIMRAKQKKVLDQSRKVDDKLRIQKEKEKMERAQREEKARIEAEMKAAKIAKQMKAETELKHQQRQRQRLELEMMVETCDLEENNFRKFDKDFRTFIGGSNQTRNQLMKDLGLFLRRDDCLEEIINSEASHAVRVVEGLEEGEILF